jgi:uncharacterized membrane protein
MIDWHFQPVFGSYLLVLLLAVVLISIMTVRPAFPSANQRRRQILNGLRGGVIGLIVLALLRPTVVHTKSEPIAATVAVLIDTSRSMVVADMDDETRWQAMRNTLKDSRMELERLHDSLEVVAYRFDQTTQPLTWDGIHFDLPDEPPGDQTDLGAALDQIVRDQTGKRLLGVVMLSDGAQRSVNPQADMRQAAWQLARRESPLYTIAYGASRDQTQARDVAIRNLQDHYRVFANTDLVVRSTVSAQGYANQAMPVQMRVEKPDGETELIGPIQITPTDAAQELDVQLSYKPKQPGQYKLTLFVPEQPGEQVKENNELTAFLDVMDGGLRVLYLCGNLGWQEHKFIRRVVDASPDMQLDFQWVDPRGRQNWPIDMLSIMDQGPYDVYVLADLEAAALGPAGCLALADEVSRGKGLIMTGGRFAFGPGGYGKTALNTVMPFRIGRFQAQPADGELRADLHVPGPLTFLPTTDHFVTTLGEDNLTKWQSLPPLNGANKFEKLTPTAQVLAQANDETPLLVTSDAGLGRFLALATDSTYRWYRFGHQSAHKRFWRQIILWLAKKEEDQKGDLWIELEQRRYMAETKANFKTGLRDADGSELTEQPLKAILIGPEGKRTPLALTKLAEEGWSGGTEALMEPGDYTLEVSVKTPPDGSAETFQRTVRFAVLDRDLELTDAAADPQQLANLSAITRDVGGRTVAAEELPDLLNEFIDRPEESRVEFQSKWQLADTGIDAWLFFCLVVGLLTTEWFLRKKWQMV